MLMSGALNNDDLCMNNPQRPSCSTGSCNAGQTKKDIDMRNKPLPKLPSIGMSPLNEEEAAFLDVRPAIAAFTREIDTRFLSPTAELVLRQLKLLSQKSRTSVRVQVQLGAETIWMDARDADTLYQLRQITRHLSIEEKRRLLDDLSNVVEPRKQYPLEQVMFHGVQVNSTVVDKPDPKENRLSEWDLSAVLHDGETEEDAKKVLKPPPLIVRKVTPHTSHQGHILSPLAELNEPTPRGRPTRDDPAAFELEAVALGKRASIERADFASSDALAPYGPRSNQKAVEEPTIRSSGSFPERGDEKRPGNVRIGRLAAEIRTRAAQKTLPVDLPAPSNTSNTSIAIAKSRRALVSQSSLFTNPRKAPVPITSITKVNSLPTARIPTQQPGNVARGQAAATAALHGEKRPDSPRPSVSSFNPDKKVGSVRNARERLKAGQRGSVRVALERIERGTEGPSASTGPEVPVSKFSERSSSLPRALQDASRREQAEKTSGSAACYNPWYVQAVSRPAGLGINTEVLFKSEVPPEGHSRSLQHPGVGNGVPNVRPSPAQSFTVGESPLRRRSSHGVLIRKISSFVPKHHVSAVAPAKATCAQLRGTEGAEKYLQFSVAYRDWRTTSVPRALFGGSLVAD